MDNPHRMAFTLIELLVVVAIIIVLLGAVITVGTSVVNSAKVRDTQALLQSLELAIDQFKNDAPLAKVKGYSKRYNDYPPDELEVFNTEGIPNGGGNLAGPTAQLEDAGGAPLDLTVTGHRDVKALALAVKLYNPSAAAILDRIDKRFVRLGETVDGLTEYFDRDQAGHNDEFREPLIYFADAWGVPIEYYAANDPCEPPNPVDSDNTPDYPLRGARLTASAAFVRANDGAPVFVSYGPDGEEQFAADMIDAEGETQLVWDFHDDYDTATVDRRINNRLNGDNVYSTPGLVQAFADEGVDGTGLP